MSSGYCRQCHAIRNADGQGRCLLCHTPLTDWQIDCKAKSDANVESKNQHAAPLPKAIHEAEELLVLPIKGEDAGIRFSALIFDLLILSILNGVWFGLTLPSSESLDKIAELGPEALRLQDAGIFLVIWIGYFFVCESAAGATPGKALSQLMVIRKDGRKIAPWQALIRAVFSIIEDNPIGALVIQFTPLRQRIGDLVAGTLVIHKAKIHRTEIKPPAITFEYFDHHQVKFARLLEGVVYKFGMIRQLVISGLTPEDRPLKLTIDGHFFRPEFDMLRLNIEKKFDLRFPEKIILSRLIVAIVAPLFIIAGTFLAVDQINKIAPAADLPLVVKPTAARASATLRATATKQPTSTRIPMPMEITFDTIANYAVDDPVILVGRLSMMSSTKCSSSYCGLLLENPSHTSQTVTIFVSIGSTANHMKPLPNPYTKTDIQVILNDGTIAAVGFRIRVTGKVCRTTADEPCISDITLIELYQVK